ncbi:Eco57I restriction-modification methylase domain-containing protein [Halosimplex amylolyticum]|uniref:Eco57I restriction-modification methylase domain-containing protein n=1 Tax=Halosimplex amylolyticum TaxID=3396616 RepID=UPI003F55DCA0
MCGTRYDLAFLREQGYFERGEADVALLDGEFAETRFCFDPDARLAYFEGVDPERQEEVVDELRLRGRNFDYYWFWNPDTERVAVYNRYGEHKWFVYDQSVGHARDVRDSKRGKLAAVDDGLEGLFDIRDVVDRFYRNLWDVRLDIARSFALPPGTEIDDEARLMAAQRTIDRLIFCYFLVEKDVIHGIDSAGNRVALDPTELFESVLGDGEFYAFLSATFFDHLNATGWTEYEVSDALSIAFPSLDGGLFRNHAIDTESGGEIRERELDGSGCDWGRLVGDLNEYNWLIEQSPDEGTDSPDKLSPAVLGHIFEKFVITVSELSDEASLSLAELDEMDVSESGEQLLAGNKQVGAYYTPNYVAYENARETLWNRVREKLAARTDLDAAAIPDSDEFFEEVRGDADPSVDLADVEDVLASLSVIDPSAGSGAFLLTAGEILEEWRRKCADGDDDRDRYTLRRDVIRESLYGVDLLDGAVEVCKLRLWLWLIGANAVDLGEADPGIEPLPNLDCNLRQGNGLVGVATAGNDGSPIPDCEFDWVDDERRTYSEAVADYRETIEAYQPASGERAEELRDRLTTQRDVLQEELNRVYAQERDVTVEESLESFDEFERTMAEVTGAVKLNLDFDSTMTHAEREQVSEAGFREQRNWKTTAYHADVRQADPENVEDVFELMADRGSVSVERPITAEDVSSLDPFHWIFEFPTAYSPTEGEAFDVVIGNPPHGSDLGSLQKSVLEDSYDLIDGSREVAKLFTERSWALTEGELSYIVPKPSTYNSNWEDFREFCLDEMHRGVDLGKAFRNVDHEQVTIHLSRDAAGDDYRCGPLAPGSYHVDGAATVDRSFAAKLGTLPVSFSVAEQEVAAGLGGVDYPTLGSIGADAGRGASTTNRIRSDADGAEDAADAGADAPIAYNGKQVQRYFTRAAEDRIETEGLSPATRERVETPKVMAQNIIAHKQNPYDHIIVASLYDPVGVYDFETVTNVVIPEESDLTYTALALLLNTQFANWFVYFYIFNRAIRDMHLDSYFLEHLVLPMEISATESELLDDLYGLLAITATAVEHDELPGAVATDDEPPRDAERDGELPGATDAYRELQSVANAVTYELYLRDATTDRLETDLCGVLSNLLDGYETGYLDWYRSHLQAGSDAAIADRFSADLFRTATEVADAVRTPEIDAELAAIAEHPWVETIERGQHTDGESRPTFGPTEDR